MLKRRKTIPNYEYRPTKHREDFQSDEEFFNYAGLFYKEGMRHAGYNTASDSVFFIKLPFHDFGALQNPKLPRGARSSINQRSILWRSSQQ